MEDEFIVAADLKQLLENLGYDVIAIVSKGNDATEIIGETDPDIVLLDIMLKGDMDGIEIAQQIRDIYDIPFVYITAFQDSKVLERAKITQPYGYLIKPFDNAGVHSAIEIALYNHRQEQKLVKTAELLESSTNKLKEINKPLK